MPLRKRLEMELRPDWRAHAIRYKDLQREAENLVGQDNEEMEYVFRSHLTYALEQANEFYLEKKDQVMSTFSTCAHAVDAIAQVHHEREKRFQPVGCGAGSGAGAAGPGAGAGAGAGDKDLFKDIVSPTNSTDHMWPRRSQEELEAMSSAFGVWARAARERRQHTIHLFDFVNPVFMARLEEGALRAALMDWLKLLTLIDHLRTFALLNTVAALKLVDRHCGGGTRAHCRAALDALPMASMEGMASLMQVVPGGRLLCHGR